MRKKIEKKYYSLFTGEFTATFAFAGVWVLYLKLYSSLETYLTSYYSLYAFALLELLLLQGSLYWYLKLKQARQNIFSNLPLNQLKVFYLLKKLNLFLFAIGAILLIYQLVTFQTELFWFIFLYLFALVEYINYFHIRLSYMSPKEIKEFRHQKGFKPSKLAKELDEYK